MLNGLSSCVCEHTQPSKQTQNFGEDKTDDARARNTAQAQCG